MIRWTQGQFPLDAEGKTALRKRGYGPGLQVFEVCPICGQAEWRCSDGNAPEDVIANIGTEPCHRCNEVQMRAPEIVNWVLAVVGFQKAMAALNQQCTQEPK